MFTVAKKFASVANILSLFPGCICSLAAYCFRHRCRLSIFYGSSETDTGPTTIGKLDTGCLECPLERFNRSLLQFISPLKPDNRVDRYLGCCSEFSNAQTQRRTGHATLDGQQNNHINVLISVEIVDFIGYRNIVLISVQNDELHRCIPDLGEKPMSMHSGLLADSADRRSFIGGSDARIIMGDDETALVRLWREKRSEIEPEDLSGNLIVQLGSVTEELNRHWYERNTGQIVTAVQRQAFHPVKRWMAATLDGMVEGTGAVFEAKFMLPWTFSEEAAAEKHMAAVAAQYVGYRVKNRGAVDHYRWRQMGRDDNSGRPALPTPAADSGEKILAVR